MRSGEPREPTRAAQERSPLSREKESLRMGRVPGQNRTKLRKSEKTPVQFWTKTALSAGDGGTERWREADATGARGGRGCPCPQPLSSRLVGAGLRGPAPRCPGEPPPAPAGNPLVTAVLRPCSLRINQNVNMFPFSAGRLLLPSLICPVMGLQGTFT